MGVPDMCNRKRRELYGYIYYGYICIKYIYIHCWLIGEERSNEGEYIVAVYIY